MFVSRKKYNDLITFCFREQKRRQDAESMVDMLKSDIAFWQGQSAVYKERADRLEFDLHHPRHKGQYSRVVPITKGATA